MNSKATRKHNIRNPEKWVGKYVRHMANWRDYEWNEQYCICEWTGKLIKIEDDYQPEFEERDLCLAYTSYEPAYYYSMEGVIGLLKLAKKNAANPTFEKNIWVGIAA